MTIEILEKARDAARKNGDKNRLLVLNDIIATVRKAETAGKKKVELTEAMVDEALLKYRKMLKDGIVSMPDGAGMRQTYEMQLNILMEYCPPVIDDEIEIENMILTALHLHGIAVSKKNKGVMMKTLMPIFKKNHVDTGVAMPLIEFMIKEAENTDG